MAVTIDRRTLLKSSLTGAVILFGGRLASTEMTAAQVKARNAGGAVSDWSEGRERHGPSVAAAARSRDANTLMRYAGEFGGSAKSSVGNGGRVDGRV